MNLTNFLKETDALLSQYSTEQLIRFIHNIGRVCPEHGREDFLRMLKSAGNGADEADSDNKYNGIDFDARYRQVRDNLERIDSQEITVLRTWNEEYDYWNSDIDDEFYFEDNSGISDMLEDACDFVHICMDMERYKEGFEVGNQMFAMEILCEDEYSQEEFLFGDMVYYGFLNCDLKQVILDAVYCAYCAVPPARRPEIVYGFVVNAKEDEITLEAIMQHGDEGLPEFEAFLPLWITYLGDRTELDADRLILEAVGLLNDVSLEASVMTDIYSAK